MSKVQISSIDIGNRYRSDFGDIESLATSISEIGLLQPICVTPDMKLIAGERRIKAHQLLGMDEIEVSTIDITEIISGEYAENEVRKNFTPSEKESILSSIKTKGRGRPAKNSQKFVNFDTASEIAGFANPETARQATKVVEKGCPSLVSAMDDNVISIYAASKLADRPKAVQEKAVLAKRQGTKRKNSRIKPVNQEINIKKFLVGIEKIAGIKGVAEVIVKGMTDEHKLRANESLKRAFILTKQIKEALDNAEYDSKTG